MALLGLFYISTFIDKSDKIFKGQATTGTVAWLLVFMTPQFVYYVIPIAALLSVLVTFGVLSKSSELTVMKACGVSLYRAAALGRPAVAGFQRDPVRARAEGAGEGESPADVLDAQIRGRAPRLFDIMNRQWVVGHDGSIYHYSYYNPERDEMTGLVIYRPDQRTWTLSSATFAEHVSWKQGWQASSGWEQDFKSNPPIWTPFTQRTLEGLETPDYFKTEQPVADMMTVGQLRHYVDELSQSGANVVPLRVDLHKKLAFPLVTFVMTLLAVPFGVSTGRRGTLYGIGFGNRDRAQLLDRHQRVRRCRQRRTAAAGAGGMGPQHPGSFGGPIPFPDRAHLRLPLRLVSGRFPEARSSGRSPAVRGGRLPAASSPRSAWRRSVAGPADPASWAPRRTYPVPDGRHRPFLFQRPVGVLNRVRVDLELRREGARGGKRIRRLEHADGHTPLDFVHDLPEDRSGVRRVNAHQHTNTLAHQ